MTRIDTVERALTASVAALSLSRGLFFAVSALYFTRGVGLLAATVGLGLSLAGVAGVVAAYVGGRLSDRFGADRMQLWALAAHGLSLLAYAAAHGVTSFILIAACVSASRGLLSTAQATLLARWYVGPDRVQVRARLRAVMNVSIGVGTLAAGLALMVDTSWAYRLTIVIVGLLTTGGTLPLVGLRSRVDGLGQRMTVPATKSETGSPGRPPLRDATYLAATALTSVMAMQFGLTSVGIPLWVADHTRAPTAIVSVLLVVNTVFVALFQVRASRGTHDVRTAARAVATAGFLLLASCVLLARAGHGGPGAATILLVLAALGGAAAETRGEAGSWGLAFELADPRRAGEYQGVSQMGYAIAQMLAPAAVTVVAVDHGTSGWLALGGVFAVTGLATAMLGVKASGPSQQTPAADRVH